MNPVKTYTAAEIAQWEVDNALPLPVLRLDQIGHLRRRLEIEAGRTARAAAAAAARTKSR